MTTTQRAAILQAVARGWCHKANSAKEMDADLAEAITAEVCAALAEQAAEQAEPVAVPAQAWELERARAFVPAGYALVRAAPPAPARQEPLNRTAIFNGWLRSRDISEDSYVMFEAGARYAESFYGITAAPAEGGANG